jgi:hypothetical protein
MYGLILIRFPYLYYTAIISIYLPVTEYQYVIGHHAGLFIALDIYRYIWPAK